MIAVGSLIGGRYRVDRILGSGGMGVVVAAMHIELGNVVAIKFLHDEMLQSPTIVERFIREARAVVGLRTEHVCRVFDVGRLDSGAPYMVMELLTGQDLAAAIGKQPLPMTTAVEYVMQACVALAEAHKAGIVHRDLKPANLFVTRRLDGGPLVKVLDFGIAKAAGPQDAKLTHTMGAMGSPGYMSPEQLMSARDVDLRTDIWALGVTLYQLLSDRLPFPGTVMTEVAIKISTQPPDPIDIEPNLRAVILRCLDKQPERRFADVGEFAEALAPFGGPSARGLATQIAHLLGRSPSLAPAPIVFVAPQPIASSLPQGPVAAPAPTFPHPPSQPQQPPSAVTEPTRPGSRAPWIALALVLVGGGLAAAFVLGQRNSSAGNSPPTPAPAPTSSLATVANDATTAAPAPTPAPSPAPAPAPAPDPTQADPWATDNSSSGVVNRPRKPARPTPTPPMTPTTPTRPTPTRPGQFPAVPNKPSSPNMADIQRQQMQIARQTIAQQCSMLIGNPNIPADKQAVVRVMCHCAKGELDAARAEIGSLPANEATQVRVACTQLGVTL